MPRFVILSHDHPILHWDLLLEEGTYCRTWRLLTDPANPLLEIAAEALPDHRLIYLDYEGPVSGDRGSVRQWDAGNFEWLNNNPERCVVTLHGQKWTGFLQLKQIDGTSWLATRRA